MGVKLDGDFNEKQAERWASSGWSALGSPSSSPIRPPNGAALQVNDVILEYNGVRVEHDTHLIGLVKLTEIGERVPIVVYRDGNPLQMFVEIGDMNEYPGNDDRRPD